MPWYLYIAQDFINPTSQDRPASSSFTTEGAEEEQSGDNDLATPEERYKALTPELKKLDAKLYHTLVLKIKLKARHMTLSFIAKRVSCKRGYSYTQSMEPLILCARPL